MIPILYRMWRSDLSAERTLHYEKTLTETISCHVVEEKNGNFYLEMECPWNAIGWSFDVGSVIEVLTAENISETNLFIVLNYKVDISGVLRIYAEQLTLNEAKKTVVLPIVQGQRSRLGMRTVIKNKLLTGIDFDIKMLGDNDPTKYTHGFDVPRSLKNALLGEKGSVLDVIGKGDFRWTKDKVYFHPATGEYARGKTLDSARIAYGENLIDYTYEKSAEDLYTQAVAYWRDEQTGTVVGSTTINPVSTVSDTMIYDASADYSEAPSKTDLEKHARIQLEQHNSIDTSLNVKFVPNKILNGSIVKSDDQSSNAIGMCDIIPISIPKIGLDSTVQIIKTDYNVLTGLYNSVEAGTPRKSLETALAQTAYRTGVSLFK